MKESLLQGRLSLGPATNDNDTKAFAERTGKKMSFLCLLKEWAGRKTCKSNQGKGLEPRNAILPATVFTNLAPLTRLQHKRNIQIKSKMLRENGSIPVHWHPLPLPQNTRKKVKQTQGSKPLNSEGTPFDQLLSSFRGWEKRRKPDNNLVPSVLDQSRCC